MRKLGPMTSDEKIDILDGVVRDASMFALPLPWLFRKALDMTEDEDSDDEFMKELRLAVTKECIGTYSRDADRWRA